MTTCTAEHLIASCRHMLSLRLVEQPDGSNHVPYVTGYYGFDGPWCAMSVSRAFFDAGFVEAVNFSTSKGFAYCPSGIAGFKGRGQWHSGTAGIRRGDVLFYDWEGDGVSDHVGVVEYVDSAGVHTIEGNSNNRYERRVRNANIVGYGRPAYATPPAPKPTPTPTPKPTPVPVPTKTTEVTMAKFQDVTVAVGADGKGVLDLGTTAHPVALAPNLDVRNHPGFSCSPSKLANGHYAVTVIGAAQGSLGVRVTLPD